MKPTVPKRSRITKAVHAGATELFTLGIIDARRMREYDLLCADPVPDYGPAAIKALRSKLKVSQTVLATLLNISASAVRKWELGEQSPSGSSARLLQLLDRKGLHVLLD